MADPCQAGTHNCSSNATCASIPTETGLTWNCTCLPGFSGDGTLCLQGEFCEGVIQACSRCFANWTACLDEPNGIYFLSGRQPPHSILQAMKQQNLTPPSMHQTTLQNAAQPTQQLAVSAVLKNSVATGNVSFGLNASLADVDECATQDSKLHRACSHGTCVQTAPDAVPTCKCNPGFVKNGTSCLGEPQNSRKNEPFT